MTALPRYLPLLCGLLLPLLSASSPTWAVQICPEAYPRTAFDDSFADAGTGMTLHMPTGLIWKRCAEGQTWNETAATCNGNATAYTWQQSFKHAAAVNAGNAGENLGQSDWRVPNINELKSLVELGCRDPAINLNWFPNAPASLFWSGSPAVSDPGKAWSLYLKDGYDEYRARNTSLHVLLVRDAPPAEE